MKKSLRNLLIFLGIAAAIGVVYFVFFNGSRPGQTASTSSLSSTARNSASQPLNASGTATSGTTLLALLGRVTGLTLNDDIFSNPSFQSLQDISITLPAVESRGRRNPFAPGGATTATPDTSTTNPPVATGTNPQ